MHSEPDLAAAATLLAEPARAELVLAALADGPLSASELASRAGVSRSTASGHLRRLVDGGFLVVAAEGRSRRYELAGPAVAEAVEALSRVAPARPARTLREANRAELIREARTCAAASLRARTATTCSAAARLPSWRSSASSSSRSLACAGRSSAAASTG